MTYREYILRTLRQFNLTDEDIELMVVNQRTLIPNPDNDVEPEVAIKAICLELASFLPIASVSEGGYSVSYNYEALRIWYNNMCQRVGIDSAFEPSITNMSDVW